MTEVVASSIARRACAVVKNGERRAKCVELLIRILTYGDSVKEEVKEEIRRTLTEEERRLLKQKLAELLE